MPNLFSPGSLKELCKKYSLTPSKKYGQNFLINSQRNPGRSQGSECVSKMIAAAGISKGDIVVEVGPGFGVLTWPLAAKAKKVVAFEIEKKLQPYWANELKKNDKVEIIWGNVLYKFTHHKLKAKTYKLIANLPYQITSQIIRFFLELPNPPQTMVLMVQKEVAQRICARPGDMSVLAVAVQYYGKPEIVVVVPKGSFWPIPKVDSAILKVSTVDKRDSKQARKFFTVVKAGFANRRKLLIKNLQSITDNKNKDLLKKAFLKAGIKEKARAQELSLYQWQGLVDFLS
jgi:16S rRNA (adenine1518-N6/adenine1519-N6)-dimethyltransferase